MKQHWEYLKYVLRHKWFVFQECLALGVPLWNAVFHDWDKFLPDEWFPYAEYFYGNKRSTEYFEHDGEAGYHTAPYGIYVGERFNFAWNHHEKRNKHHWQYWVLIEDSGKILPLPMSPVARKEMLADWHGAGRAITGKRETKQWYEKNRDKMILHPETRAWIESQLGIGER